MHRALLLVALACFLNSCGRAEQKRVIIDDWYNVNYASNWCSSQSSIENDPICAMGDPALDLRAFEDTIRTAFGRESSCAGLVVATFSGPDENKILNAHRSADWSLKIDFAPGQRRQAWKLVGRSPDLVSSTGTAKEIAKAACVALKGEDTTVIQ
jgi:hypothetical protein